MAETEDLVARLQKIPLFKRIDAQSLAILTQFLQEEQYQDGETIFQERDPGGAMYAIESGAVVISKVIDWQDRTEKTLAILPAGAFFGEGGLLENDPRSANVRARGPTRVIRVDRSGFLQVLQAAPLSAIQLLFGITRIINARLRQTSHELVTLFDTGKLAGAGLALDALLTSILERCMESTDSQKGAVFLVNPYTEELEVGAFQGMAPAPPFGLRADLAGGLQHPPRGPAHRPPPDRGS
jgi:CRP-like cAMP-binding protein